MEITTDDLLAERVSTQSRSQVNWNKWVRHVHRWLSIAFTASVILVTILVLGQEEPAAWVYFSPLLPLALLMCHGLYLFVLPHAAKWRGGRRLARSEDVSSVRRGAATGTEIDQAGTSSHG